MANKRSRQALGSRKTAKTIIPLDISARQVVQWFYQHRTQNVSEIIRLTGLPRNFTTTWAPRTSTELVYKGTKKRGPAKLIADDELQDLASKVRNKRFASAEKVRSEYKNPKTGKALAASTIRLRLQDAGLINVKVRRTPLLTIAHREHRLWFANEYKRENWKNWIWSDEKWFYIGGIKGNEKMWVDMADPDPDERYVGRVGHPTKVMVWGCITYHGRSSLHFFDSSVDSQEYQKCIKEAMLPALYDKEYMGLTRGRKYVFQQDGARCHTSNNTEEWLEENLPDGLSFTPRYGWSPNSPDLSIIENLWAVLQDKVIEELAFTEEKLSECIERHWWAIPQSIIQDLYDDIPRRMKAVIETKGGRIPRMK